MQSDADADPSIEEELTEAEEEALIRLLDAALAEPGEPIPWEQAMRELGWTDDAADETA
jgi:hypothetical protein